MAEEVKSADAPVQQLAKGPFVHSLCVYLVGGQQFTLNEVTDSPEVPRNVVAFINAWRAKKDVWHSPNNDVHFGVRVKDVSMYEYRVGQPAAPKAEEEKVEAEVAAEAQAKAEA